MLKAAKLPPGPKSPLERALGFVKSTSAVDTLSTLTRNVAQNPREPKYRKLRLSNVKIAAALVEPEGALDVLRELGWVNEGDDFMVLPDSVQLTMTHVRAVEAQRETLETLAKAKAKARLLSKSAKNDPEKERLLLQLEADRQERAAQAPVTRGSIARSVGSGSNIVSAGDLGLNQCSGGS
eukprot:CAMPEP_0114250144 /NCGR_PEP_ID=MMETSP0058-20121206/14539_1 /TAXON_ID=36894 /ORGANISM="Pyramimonas parkeae, CCMP726" /LENGTH=180 /DNA_ID=CAMNT_0001363777 /DNA_START=118 /DNA_END=660 /DNA_ORIENTATION=-